jgi:hypothetical protein
MYENDTILSNSPTSSSDPPPPPPLYTASKQEETVAFRKGNNLHHQHQNSSTTMTTTHTNYWRPESLSRHYHSWDKANVNRIVTQEDFQLTETQIQKLWAFHKATSTKHKHHWKVESPYTALQFLKEWRWKVPAAVKAFDKMIQWRIENNVDGMIDPSSPNYHERHADFYYFPQGMLQGVDKQGNPIYIDRTGAAHLHTLLQRHGIQEGLQASTWMREMCTTGSWVQEWESQAGRGLSGMTTIVDLQGLNRQQHMAWSILNLVKDGTKIIQANWPCEAKRVIIIRAPGLFRYAWSFLKPFLTETVKEMITICTAADPLPELAEYVDLDVLPPCINPKGHGKAWPEFGPIVWEGGPIPTNTAEVLGLPSSSSSQNIKEQEEDMMMASSLSYQRKTSVDLTTHTYSTVATTTTTATTRNTTTTVTSSSSSSMKIGEESASVCHFQPRIVTSLGVGSF